MFPQEISHPTNAEERLLWQFSDSHGVKSLTKALADELQQIQLDTFAVYNNLDINDAYGDFLDILGSDVSLPRGGRSDTEYRDAIILKQILTTADATPDSILTSLAVATRSDNVRLWEHYPISTAVYTDGDRLPRGLSRALRFASVATSKDVTILFDTTGTAFTPIEGGFDTADLGVIDEGQEKELFNFSDGLTFEVNLATNAGDDGSTLGLLSEHTYGQGSNSIPPDGLGILCEVSLGDKGLQTYSQ